MTDISTSNSITITFSLDDTVKAFNSDTEIFGWLDSERGQWNRYRPTPNDPPGSALANNLKILDAVSRTMSGDALGAQLRAISNQYLPISGEFGKVLNEISKRSNEVPRIAAAFLINPAFGWVQNNRDYTEGKAVVAAFRVTGSLLLHREDLATGLRELAEIRQAFSADSKEMRTLRERAEAEWNDKIAGFEAKIALGAPKQYWGARAAAHEKAAIESTRSWNRSIGYFAAGSLIGALLVLTPFGTWLLEKIIGIPGPTSDKQFEFYTYASTVQRVVFFGTFMAIGVWWLRQKLRARWTHEHLAEDAAERATMVETYAAMKGSGLDAGNSALILNALYRPAIGGLAADEAPVLPLELLAKLLGKVTTRE